MMNDRQQALLRTIVTDYIRTAQPVGSQLIAETGRFKLSPATIRNEMVELESSGYLRQPHTSAGRVPTAKGYQFYVDHFLQAEPVSRSQERQLTAAVTAADRGEPDQLKALAKAVADLADNAVFVGFSASNLYYTGLSNLFSQPEFVEHDLVRNLSEVIDHLDRVVDEIFSVINQVDVMIGDRNPFGHDCSAIVAKYQTANSEGLLGIIGPIRMDYQNNLRLIRYSLTLVRGR